MGAFIDSFATMADESILLDSINSMLDNITRIQGALSRISATLDLQDAKFLQLQNLISPHPTIDHVPEPIDFNDDENLNLGFAIAPTMATTPLISNLKLGLMSSDDPNVSHHTFTGSIMMRIDLNYDTLDQTTGTRAIAPNQSDLMELTTSNLPLPLDPHSIQLIRIPSHNHIQVYQLNPLLVPVAHVQHCEFRSFGRLFVGLCSQIIAELNRTDSFFDIGQVFVATPYFPRDVKGFESIGDHVFHPILHLVVETKIGDSNFGISIRNMVLELQLGVQRINWKWETKSITAIAPLDCISPRTKPIVTRNSVHYHSYGSLISHKILVLWFQIRDTRLTWKGGTTTLISYPAAKVENQPHSLVISHGFISKGFNESPLLILHVFFCLGIELDVAFSPKLVMHFVSVFKEHKFVYDIMMQPYLVSSQDAYDIWMIPWLRIVYDIVKTQQVVVIKGFRVVFVKVCREIMANSGYQIAGNSCSDHGLMVNMVLIYSGMKCIHEPQSINMMSVIQFCVAGPSNKSEFLATVTIIVVAKSPGGAYVLYLNGGNVSPSTFANFALPTLISYKMATHELIYTKGLIPLLSGSLSSTNLALNSLGFGLCFKYIGCQEILLYFDTPRYHKMIHVWVWLFIYVNCDTLKMIAATMLMKKINEDSINDVVIAFGHLILGHTPDVVTQFMYLFDQHMGLIKLVSSVLLRNPIGKLLAVNRIACAVVRTRLLGWQIVYSSQCFLKVLRLHYTYNALFDDFSIYILAVEAFHQKVEDQMVLDILGCLLVGSFHLCIEFAMQVSIIASSPCHF